MRIFALMCIFWGSLVYAQTPMWSCDIEGEMEGYAIGVVVSYKGLAGPATVTCHSIDGTQVENLEVEMDLRGFGIGFGFADVRRMRVVSLNIGVANGVRSFTGNFSVGPAVGASFAHDGVEFGPGIELSQGGLSFELAFSDMEVAGAELHLHANGFSISER